jgi:hypothetical protein
MEQIKVLRGRLAQPASGNDHASETASAQATADEKVQPTGQSSSPNHTRGDDKSQSANISAVTESAAAQAAAGEKVSPTEQSPGQNQSNGDDKTQSRKVPKGMTPFLENSIRVGDLLSERASTGS